MRDHPNSAQAVIGANYGDEGKGLVVDKLASQNDGKVIVIRHNSSAQAGHTVQTPDGRRHVFHHIGSGSFAGAETFLSQFFMCHPMLLAEELDELQSLSIAPKIYVDERSPVATPYDLLLNQAIENQRGKKRHGSCGVGFGEAVERTIRPRYALHVKDLVNRRHVKQRLQWIRDEWIPYRIEMLNIELDEVNSELIYGDAILRRFLEDVEFFLYQVKQIKPGELPECDHLLFEGAQGLALSEDAEGFPHVTRSKTGLANAIRIAQETGIDTLEAVYVTRAYLTRHGAGPLSHEYPNKPYPDIMDKTNIPNSFQGKLRFADLDIDKMYKRIQKDLSFHAMGITVVPKLALTCLDQVPETLHVVYDGVRRSINTGTLPDIIYANTNVPVKIRSYGPTREDCVTELV